MKAFRMFMSGKTSAAALICICIISLLAVFGPFLNPYAFNEPMRDVRNLPPRIKGVEKLGILNGTRVLKNRRVENLADYPPGSVLKVYPPRFEQNVELADVLVNVYILNGADDKYFWFGTDNLGRDMWTRLWRGTRLSLLIALAAVFINTVIGTLFGSISGYYGGAADMLLMRLAEIMDSLPQIAVFTLLIIFIGPGIWPIILALCIRGWTGTARLVRAQFYRYKGFEYVLASRTIGAGDARIIFRHILPNAVGPVITRSMAAIPGAIFIESFLAYLGLGIQAPEPSLGVLLADGRHTLLEMPYQTFFPAIVVSILMISFNMLSIGLREALDPTRRGEV